MPTQSEGPDGPKGRRPRKKTVPRRSKASRGTGKHPARASVAATFMRNVRIAKDRQVGLSIETCAKKYGVSRTTISDVSADWAIYLALATDEDIMDYLQKQMLRYEILFEMLAEIVHSTESAENKIAGIREQMRAMREGIVLRQSTGILPNDLGDVHVHIDFVTIGRRLADAMEAEQVPLPAQERIIDVVAGTVNETASNGANGSDT